MLKLPLNIRVCGVIVLTLFSLPQANASDVVHIVQEAVLEKILASTSSEQKATFADHVLLSDFFQLESELQVKGSYDPTIVISLAEALSSDSVIMSVLESQSIQRQLEINYNPTEQSSLLEPFYSVSSIQFKPVSQPPELVNLAMLSVGCLALLMFSRRKRVKQRTYPYRQSENCRG